jgi:formate dehydrogenase beta subunit
VEMPKGVEVAKENPAKSVYMGGDALTGAATVIEAVQGGRKGAELIDKSLGGEGDIEQVLSEKEEVNLWSGPGGVDTMTARAAMPMIPPQERDGNFSEVCPGLDKDAAMAEAKRCLRCDLRFSIASPSLPPEQWLLFDQETIDTVTELEGVFTLYYENKEIYNIIGVINLREGLQEELDMDRDAKYFVYEEDPMYTGKERQLVQVYMKQHGGMPPGADDMDDLF